MRFARIESDGALLYGYAPTVKVIVSTRFSDFALNHFCESKQKVFVRAQ